MAKIVTAAFKKCKNFLVEKASNFREAASNATGKGRLTKEGEGRTEEGKSGVWRVGIDGLGKRGKERAWNGILACTLRNFLQYTTVCYKLNLKATLITN
jgi:hypothetical protein